MLARSPRSETRKSSLPVRAIILPVFLLILVSVPSLMRAQNPNGALRGEVQDATAARVPHAQVIVESNASSITRAVTADDRGEFHRVRRIVLVEDDGNVALLGDIPCGQHEILGELLV